MGISTSTANSNSDNNRQNDRTATSGNVTITPARRSDTLPAKSGNSAVVTITSASPTPGTAAPLAAGDDSTTLSPQRSSPSSTFSAHLNKLSPALPILTHSPATIQPHAVNVFSHNTKGGRTSESYSANDIGDVQQLVTLTKAQKSLSKASTKGSSSSVKIPLPANTSNNKLPVFETEPSTISLLDNIGSPPTKIGLLGSALDRDASAKIEFRRGSDKSMLFPEDSATVPVCGSPLLTSPAASYRAIPETPLLTDFVPQSLESSSEIHKLIKVALPAVHARKPVHTSGFSTSEPFEGFKHSELSTSSERGKVTASLDIHNKPEQLRIHTLISWNNGGKSVYVLGTFNDWKQKIPLQKSKDDFTTVLNLTTGTHKLKFIVDGEWMCSHDLDTVLDHTGNLVNYIEVRPEDVTKDVGEILEETQRAVEAQSESTDSPYGQDIPAYLTIGDSFSTDHPSGASSLGSTYTSNDEYLRSLDSSYSAGFGGSSYYNSAASSYSAGGGFSTGLHALTTYTSTPSSLSRRPNPLSEPPPMLPPHLESIILNVSNSKQENNPDILTVPNHVCINHLYALSVRDGVMGLATTRRYKNKYITTLYYRPVYRSSAQAVVH